MKNPSIAIIGCGKLGTALTKKLVDTGFNISGIASKSLDSAKNTAKICNIDKVFEKLTDATKNADITFLTVPDGEIESLCKYISKAKGFKEKSIVVHCSGALASTILNSAKTNKAHIASMHPLQSFPVFKANYDPFDGIITAIEGDKQILEEIKVIAEKLGTICLRINTDAKLLYHASAVVASNYLVTLMDFAFSLLEKSGIEKKDAFKVLGPIIKSTLKNIETHGAVEALTGPIVRNDKDIIKKHIDEIEDKLSNFSNLYKLLGFHTVDVAHRKGSLSDKDADGLRNFFTSKD